MGAMENNGRNIFNSRYVLASPETATDDDYYRIEAIIAHEYFPQLTEQPHHLPRLVPTMPQGRPDRLPAPQFFPATCGRPPCVGSRMFVTLRRPPVREDDGPLAHPWAPKASSRSTTSTPRPSYEKVPRSSDAQVAGRRRRLQARLDLYFEPPRRWMRPPSRTGSRSSRTVTDRDLSPIQSGIPKQALPPESLGGRDEGGYT